MWHLNDGNDDCDAEKTDGDSHRGQADEEDLFSANDVVLSSVPMKLRCAFVYFCL